MGTDVTLGLVRHILTFIGGYIVSKGWISGEALDSVIGAILTLGAVFWSVTQKVTMPQPVGTAPAGVTQHDKAPVIGSVVVPGTTPIPPRSTDIR